MGMPWHTASADADAKKCDDCCALKHKDKAPPEQRPLRIELFRRREGCVLFVGLPQQSSERLPIRLHSQ